MNLFHQKFEHLPILIATCLTFLIVFAGIFLGQRAWSNRASLTREFETCMENAPYRQFWDQSQLEHSVQPEELPAYFDNFDRIFNATGLPPVWDGAQLVPWKTFHKESILVAKSCHEKLGIQTPQKQLQGTYSKAVWDPNSQIWQSEEEST